MSERREHAILFTGEMVRAILDGRKRQTRRVVTARNSTVLGEPCGERSPAWTGLLFGHPECRARRTSTLMEFVGAVAGKPAPEDIHLSVPWVHPEDAANGRAWEYDQCLYRVRPRIERGDLLWVRETFCVESNFAMCDPRYHPPFDDGRPVRWREEPGGDRWWEQAHYRATDPKPDLVSVDDDKPLPWKPSIFMPRWASRITLEVTSVMVERVQDITEDDARAEGVGLIGSGPRLPDGGEFLGYALEDITYRACFARLWDTINAKRGYPWASNPWVWVVEFRPVEPAPHRKGEG